MHFMDLLESKCSDGQWEFKVKLVSPLNDANPPLFQRFQLSFDNIQQLVFFFLLYCIPFFFFLLRKWLKKEYLLSLKILWKRAYNGIKENKAKLVACK